MFVPITKGSHIARSISDLRFTDELRWRLVNPLVGLHRPNFGTLLATLLREVDAAKLARLGHFPGSLAPTIRRELRQFDDSMADRFQSRRALW
jgi:hypothetical protein